MLGTGDTGQTGAAVVEGLLLLEGFCLPILHPRSHSFLPDPLAPAQTLFLNFITLCLLRLHVMFISKVTHQRDESREEAFYF